jgi:hypothetical protein
VHAPAVLHGESVQAVVDSSQPPPHARSLPTSGSAVHVVSCTVLRKIQVDTYVRSMQLSCLLPRRQSKPFPFSSSARRSIPTRLTLSQSKKKRKEEESEMCVGEKFPELTRQGWLKLKATELAPARPAHTRSLHHPYRIAPCGTHVRATPKEVNAWHVTRRAFSNKRSRAFVRRRRGWDGRRGRLCLHCLLFCSALFPHVKKLFH